MKRIKDFFAPSFMPTDVYFQSFSIQLGLGILFILVFILTLLFQSSLGSWDGPFIILFTFDLVLLIEILFSIIYPLLKRHDIKFRNRLIIIALSPGFTASITFCLYRQYFPGEILVLFFM